MGDAARQRLIADLKGLVTMDEVAQRYGVRLHRDGRWLAGRCPFHDDRTPSFKIPPGNQWFQCFGCGARGDIFDFVARAEGVTFPEAIDRVLGLSGIAGGVTRFEEPEEVREPGEGDLAAIEAAAAFYARALARTPAAVRYLRSRGVSAATATRLRLGYGAPGLAAELDRLGLTGAGFATGLLAPGRDGGPPWEVFRGRVIVPDLDEQGRARWLTGRALPRPPGTPPAAGRREPPKYLNVRLPKPVLGLARQRGRTAVAVEGPFDWLVLQEWRLPAVALTGGASGRRAVEALSRFDRVYLALDSDAAGQQAAAELAAALGERARTVRLPEGVKDVAELGPRRDGRAIFHAALRAARERG